MKSPEEQAKDLIEKFKEYAHTEWDSRNGWDEETKTMNATQSAIICVEEILKNKHECGCEQSVVINGKYETYLTYWNQVLSLLKNKQQ